MAGPAEQPVEFGDVPFRDLQGIGPEPVEQPDLLESVCAGGDLLRRGAQASGLLATTVAQYRLQGESTPNAP